MRKAISISKNFYLVVIILLNPTVVFSADNIIRSDYFGIGVGGVELNSDKSLTFDNNAIQLFYGLADNMVDYQIGLTQINVNKDIRDIVKSLTQFSLSLRWHGIVLQRADYYGLVGIGYESVDTPRDNFNSGALMQAGIGININITPRMNFYSEVKKIFIYGNKDGTASESVFVIGLNFKTGNTTTKIVDKKPILAAKRNVDSDMDGVLDNQDQCPNTPSMFEVSSLGCPKTTNFGVTFGSGSDGILRYYKKRLKEFAEFLINNPTYDVTIEGHTDNSGSEKNNQILSEKRAEVIGRKLMNLGVAAIRINIVGYGSSRPIATNDNDAGRALNRRVIGLLNNRNKRQRR